ncbi:CHASE2 domain-containing protein [Capilliphycus salinus ALCB114379]|uniref:CHASE2 domain-containing protein n=1 Tax=Capilliphycus salinus TaxID=2768948 RepID=UPI0039A4C18F
MSKLIILSLAQGSLKHGFPVVTAQLWTEESFEKINAPFYRRYQPFKTNRFSPSTTTPNSMKFLGSLPPAPDLEQLYKQWQLLYNALSQRLGWSVRIKIDSEEILQVSEIDFHRTCIELQIQMNTWLNSQPFRRIDQQLRRYLSPNDEIRIILETDNDQLRRLPWHLWDFFEDYPHAEMALSTVESVGIYSQTQPGKVRILAVLGNSVGVDIEADRQLLEALPDGEIVFLKEPRRRELDEHLWDKQGWDILFFAGHSHTDGETGLLHINQTDTITVSQLKNALRTSIARGLQLAIFNSCDGLGLARQLEDLNMGQIIVMREPVSDAVAQAFLRYFLATFARRGWHQIPLHQAVKEAREKLQPLEDEFPCASWMPVLCQNPATEPLTWQKLRGSDPKRLRVAQGASVATTLLIIALRSLGWLQTWEWQTFDQLMRLRPDETVDQRLLIVAATPQDINQYGYPLPEQIWENVIQKLNVSQPRVMGLGFFKSRAEDEFINQLKNYKNLVALCQYPEPQNPNKPGIKPPPDVPISRLGFSDVVLDQDHVLRRYLMLMKPYQEHDCHPETAFSLRLALNYLAVEGMQFEDHIDWIKIGERLFYNLSLQPGSYHHQRKNLAGFQTILNYRSKVSEVVTVSQVLQGQVSSELIQDRIILIGMMDETTASSTYYSTPYSAGEQPYREMAAVEIHAQMVSHIISTVLDNRPQIQFWSGWGENLWLWSASVLGGLMGWKFRRVWVWGIATSGAIFGVSVACYSLLLIGFWVPNLSAGLAVLMSGGVVMMLTTNPD